ncbi:hypothetical protein [Microbacterium sp. MPKO10]|uniref:hypothetical protein n=1 Tax=Microbacterium sp. MPKO10 TaxID=2989818 RepID=UPI002235DE0E|nr:hypothetical protein [Microbacterium sp. MPKO10]MCW4457084.1 hypothetical protein [Microbacterium sp. MPKO10]
MASILLHTDRLEIKLTAAEKMLARRSESLVIPRDSIRSVALTDDPWIWVRGVRAPGTAVPLTLAIGQWKFHGGKDFLVLKGSRPAVVIDLIDEEFRRVLVSTRKGVELIAALRLEERKPHKVRVHHAKPRTKAVASFSEKDDASKGAKKAPKKTAPKKPAAKKAASTGGTSGAPAESADAATQSTPAPKRAAPKKAVPKKTAQKKTAEKKTAQAKRESRPEQKTAGDDTPGE